MTYDKQSVRCNAVLDAAVLEPVTLVAAWRYSIWAHVHYGFACQRDGLSRLNVCAHVLDVTATYLSFVAVFRDLYNVRRGSEFGGLGASSGKAAYGGKRNKQAHEIHLCDAQRRGKGRRFSGVPAERSGAVLTAGLERTTSKHMTYSKRRSENERNSKAEEASISYGAEQVFWPGVGAKKKGSQERNSEGKITYTHGISRYPTEITCGPE
ncbi:MAG: hypothetical protein Q8K57_05960 [Thiobacillus sp.]|nr:hypothetical protein [Thiobacillus sp.]